LLFRAGCLGINLIAANRVIVMDVSWNPCLDAQAVCRVYRYGQRRHCYIYRLIADFTMEKRIYDRQVAKQGMSDRVVDELQPQNQFTRNEVENLIHFATEEEPPAADLLTKIDEITDDDILIRTCKEYSQSITKVPFTHESLLCDRKEHQLTSAEKRRAQREYQDEKRMSSMSYRSRMPQSRSYSRLFNDHPHHSYMYSAPSTSSFESQYPISQSMKATTSMMTPLPQYSQQQIHDRKLEQLKQHGISVQQIVLKNPLQVQLSATDREQIPAGVRIHVIKSDRGSYIRTPDGKFYAIRQNSTNNTQSNVKGSTEPRPPPPLPPSQLSSNPIDQFLFDPSALGATSSNFFSNLDDEINLLIDDHNSQPLPPPPPPPSSSSSSSSAFENLSTWHNDYFQQPNFYQNNFFPNNSSLTTTNLESDNNPTNYSSNAVSFM